MCKVPKSLESRKDEVCKQEIFRRAKRRSLEGPPRFSFRDCADLISQVVTVGEGTMRGGDIDEVLLASRGLRFDHQHAILENNEAVAVMVDVSRFPVPVGSRGPEHFGLREFVYVHDISTAIHRATLVGAKVHMPNVLARPEEIRDGVIGVRYGGPIIRGRKLRAKTTANAATATRAYRAVTGCTPGIIGFFGVCDRFFNTCVVTGEECLGGAIDATLVLNDV